MIPKITIIVFEVFNLFFGGKALDFTRFGTKTPYHALPLRPATLDEYSSVLTDDLSECPAIQSTGIYRHGARNPVSIYINGINQVHDALESVSNMDIRTWSNPITESEEFLLNGLGEAEMRDQGNRLTRRLSSMFSSGGNSKTEYISSDTQRTKESARYFFNGMSEFKDVGDFDLSLDEGSIIHNCLKHVETIQMNNSATVEVTNFDSGPLRTAMVERIRSKLNLSDSTTIGLAETTFIYQYCAYEAGIFNKSVWCDLLDDMDISIMEYLDDLKIYWFVTYGHALNYQKACPLVSNIFKEMDSFVNDTNKDQRKSFRLMFGHVSTVMSLLAALDFYKDTQSLTANTMEQHVNRKLQSSKIIPFSGNLVFVLYKCNTTVDTMINGKVYRDAHVMRLFLNEEELSFPGCRTGYCPYTFLREKYHNFIYNCDLEKLCAVGNGGDGVSVHLSLAVALSTLILRFFLTNQSD